VRIVDPKRVRNFARSAGRLAKNGVIDAEMIAWLSTASPLARVARRREVLDAWAIELRRIIGRPEETEQRLVA
jgi:transposase